MKRAKGIWAVLLGISLCFTAVPVSRAENAGITRVAFYETVMKMMEEKGTITHFGLDYEPFADVSNPYVSEAYALGLVKGDGCGNFYPDTIMTREQAAVAIKRIQDYIVPRLIYDNTKAKAVGDRSEIADYAVSSVMQLTMSGTIGGGRFYPKAGADMDFLYSAMEHIYHTVIYQPVSRPGALPARKVPVLMYHTIDYVAGRPNAYLYVTPDQFEEQIQYLSQNGYTFLFPDEMYYADYCEKPVVITFDDGYADNYTNAYPILNRYNAKATVFVACDNIGQWGMLTKEQIKALSDSGIINIGSHAKIHRDLTPLPHDELQEEMAGSQWLLEQITGKKITNIAYPHGYYNDTVIAQAKRYFASGMAVNKGRSGDAYAIRRETVDGRNDMAWFCSVLNRY